MLFQQFRVQSLPFRKREEKREEGEPVGEETERKAVNNGKQRIPFLLVAARRAPLKSLNPRRTPPPSRCATLPLLTLLVSLFVHGRIMTKHTGVRFCSQTHIYSQSILVCLHKRERVRQADVGPLFSACAIRSPCLSRCFFSTASRRFRIPTLLCSLPVLHEQISQG